jgi:RNA polymerase sigma-70 factor (ECF subfamily)
VTRNFRSFFDQNYDDVVRNLTAAGACAETAADCAQEAFVRAYARWWRIGAYREPAAWVQKVAGNLLRDVQRGRRRHEAALGRLSVEAVALTGDAGDEVVDAADLTEAMGHLPPQQRRAVDIYYRDGLSTDEGADAMGISAGAFRFHLNRARINLRPHLDDTISMEAS